MARWRQCQSIHDSHDFQHTLRSTMCWVKPPAGHVATTRSTSVSSYRAELRQERVLLQWAEVQRIDRQGRNLKWCGGASDAVDGIERRVLIGTIAQRILQIVVHSKTSANYGLFRERTPGQSDARLRQELGMVGGE